jgi:hypothetical protein
LLDQRSLDEMAARLAPILADLGVVAGTSVAVVARNRPELLVIDAAAAAQGASVVHIDPEGSPSDADRALAEARPRIVVCEHAEQVPFARARVRGAGLVVLGSAGTSGALPWSQLVGEARPFPDASPDSVERVLCDAHLSLDGSGEALRRLLRDGASVALAPSGVDRHAVAALRPTMLVTSAGRIDALTRELRRRAPVRRASDRRAVGWAVIGALPALAWAVSSTLEVGSTGMRATVATMAAVAFAATALAMNGRHAVVLAAGAGALLALASDAAGSAPSVVALGRFAVATMPVAVLTASLARSSREIAWAQAVAAARGPGRPRRSPVRILRAGIGRLVAARVRSAVGLPACRRVLVVGDAPAGTSVADLAVTRMEVAHADPDVPVASPQVLVSSAGEGS